MQAGRAHILLGEAGDMVGELSLIPAHRPGVRLTEERRWGLRVIRAQVAAPPGGSGRRLERRVDKAAKQLSRLGVRCLLTPADCPWWPSLRAWGLVPVDGEPLVQALGAKLALAELERRGCAAREATVALTGSHVTWAIRAAAQELCPRVRNVAVATRAGDGAELTAQLRREFGLPALELAKGADVTLSFSPRAGTETPEALKLWGPEPELGGLWLDTKGELPAEKEGRLAVLTLLWESGAVKREEILVNL